MNNILLLRLLGYPVIVTLAVIAVDPLGLCGLPLSLGRLESFVGLGAGFWFIFARQTSIWRDDIHAFLWIIRRGLEIIIVVQGPSWHDLDSITMASAKREFLVFLAVAKGYALLGLTANWYKIVKSKPILHPEGEHTV